MTNMFLVIKRTEFYRRRSGRLSKNHCENFVFKFCLVFIFICQGWMLFDLLEIILDFSLQRALSIHITRKIHLFCILWLFNFKDSSMLRLHAYIVKKLIDIFRYQIKWKRIKQCNARNYSHSIIKLIFFQMDYVNCAIEIKYNLLII